MKKYFIIPLTFLVFLTACQKNNNDNEKEYLEYNEVPREKLWGYNDLVRFGNSIKLMEFYEKIDKSYTNFNNSEKDLSATEIKTSSGTINYYVIDKVDYASFHLKEYEAISVIKSYSYDHPGYFWISNDILSNDNNIALTCDEKYHLSKDRDDANININEYVLNLQKKIPKDSKEDEIIDIIHNYILDTSTYGYPNDIYDSFDSHNIIGITNYGLGVCESYAKTYQYLLSIFGIENVFACGNILNDSNTFESHAWNLVKKNKKWYLIDPTFDDSNDTKNNYLKNKSKIEKTYFADQNTELIYAENFNYILPDVTA